MIEVGKQIRQEREKQGYSLKAFAKKIHYSEKHLGQVERGVDEAGYELIQRAEKALHTKFITEYARSDEKTLMIQFLKVYSEKFNDDINIDKIVSDYCMYTRISTRLRKAYREAMKLHKEE